jgi:soluble lytic murein transglycosylase
MTWRAKQNVVFLTFLLFLAGILFTALTCRTAYAKSESGNDDTIGKTVAYLKDKNVPMKEDTLKKVVDTVYRESRRRDLDYRLALAVIDVESNFKHNAVSRKGARGLMQIMPSLAKGIAKDAGVKYKSDRCLNEPDKNISLGIYHLSKLVGDFKTIPAALHAYNAGETRMRARVSKREPRTSYTKQVIQEYKKSLRILPDAGEPRARVASFPTTSRENTRVAASFSGRMTLQPSVSELRTFAGERTASRHVYEQACVFRKRDPRSTTGLPLITLFPQETLFTDKEGALAVSVAFFSWKLGQPRPKAASMSTLVLINIRPKEIPVPEANRILRI